MCKDQPVPLIRSTNSGGAIRAYLKLVFTDFWLGEGVATRFRVLGICIFLVLEYVYPALQKSLAMSCAELGNQTRPVIQLQSASEGM